MHVVHKIKISDSSDSIIEIPHGSKILSIQLQGGKPTLWFIRGNGKNEAHRIVCIPSGKETHVDIFNAEFLGTVQLAGGRVVLHYFEIRGD